MEIQTKQPIIRQPDIYSFTGINGDSDEQKRLTTILKANSEISREKKLFNSYQEKAEAELMRHPLTIKQAFAYFGLMLGIFPPASIFIKLFHRGSEEIGLFILLFLANLVCGIVGYFSGKFIGKIVLELENRSWNVMLLTLPFIGIIWGIMTGGAGGLLIFVIGAFFGAFVAAVIGSMAVPAFAIFHRLLKKGEMIERNHFLPIAFGITFIISALILGL